MDAPLLPAENGGEGGASRRRLPRGVGAHDHQRTPALVPLELTEDTIPHAQDLLLFHRRKVGRARVREARDGVDVLPLIRVVLRLASRRNRSPHGPRRSRFRGGARMICWISS